MLLQLEKMPAEPKWIGYKVQLLIAHKKES